MKHINLMALTVTVILTACGGGGGTPNAQDTTSPTVTLGLATTQSSGKKVITATASDNVRVTKVEFYQDATLLATVTDAPFTYAADLTGNREGFTARAYDAAGNVGMSSTFSVTTLYQGNWSWKISTLDGGTLLDSGAAMLSYESATTGSLVPTSGDGNFQNSAGTISGDISIGEIGGDGKLNVSFMKVVPMNGWVDISFYVMGTDADRELTTNQGKAVFSGTGFLYKPGEPTENILVTLVQESALLPSTSVANAAMSQAAR